MDNSKKSSNYIWVLWLLFGLVIVLIEPLIMTYLGTSSVVDVRDQLDGEIVVYFLRAKHLFSGFIPEFMGGMNSSALTLAAPIVVLFYKVGTIYTGYLLSFAFVKITAYLGMFFLCDKCWKCPHYVSMGVGVTFAYLPFYPVYGLCGPGVPLVIIAYYALRDNYKKWWAYLLLVLYCAASSPVLVGFAVIFIYLIFAIIHSIKKAKNKKGLWLGLSVMMGTYILFNLGLIKDLLFGETSHKSQMVYFGTPFVYSFTSVLFKGIVATPSYHTYCLLIGAGVGIIALLYVLIRRKKTLDIDEKITTNLKTLGIFLIIGVLIALWNSIFVSDFVANIRNNMGTLGSFQANRFYWLYPALWYGVLALALSIIIKMCEIKKDRLKTPAKVLSYIAVTALMAVCAFNVLWVGTFRYNLRQVVVGNPGNSLTFGNFFDFDEYEDIGKYILENEGLNKDEYKVASLGIEPAVALVNGFYTIDGYSNNYPLAYKEEFRKIMASELERNINNVWYYDYWGNRCCILAAQFNGNQYLGRGDNVVYEDLNLDVDAMKALDCDYLLSVGEIKGAEEKGFSLLKRFDDARYTYCVYLYKIK